MTADLLNRLARLDRPALSGWFRICVPTNLQIATIWSVDVSPVLSSGRLAVRVGDHSGNVIAGSTRVGHQVIAGVQGHYHSDQSCVQWRPENIKARVQTPAPRKERGIKKTAYLITYKSELIVRYSPHLSPCGPQ